MALSPVGVTIHGGGWSLLAAERDAARRRAEADLEEADRNLRAAKRASQAAKERQARRDRAGQSYAASGSAPKNPYGPTARARAKQRRARQRLRRKRITTSVAQFEAVRTRVEVSTPLHVVIPPSNLPSNRLVLTFDEVTLCVGPRKIIDRLSFSLQGPERVALTGRNGSGRALC